MEETVVDFGKWSTKYLREGEKKRVPYGFIYVITNNDTGRRYIGKKQCLTILKRAPLKGKKRRRWETKETDWRNYTSSSKELNDDLEKLGIDKFSFDILRVCDNKAQLAYYEAKLQFEHDVLLDESYYNGIINLRCGRKGLK